LVARYIQPMADYQLAQLNIGRIVAPLDSPQLAGFVARLEEINALADGASGFVWRFQTEDGNATALRPFDDERMLVNFSVWESAEALHTFVYLTQHAEVMRYRRGGVVRAGQPLPRSWGGPRGPRPPAPGGDQALAHLP